MAKITVSVKEVEVSDSLINLAGTYQYLKSLGLETQEIMFLIQHDANYTRLVA